MTITLTPQQVDLDTQITAFLKTILPGLIVRRGQVNRVGEPPDGDFVIFWPLSRPRLGTNTDTFQDTVFVGAIAGNTLTVTSVQAGELQVGSVILGPGVADNTTVTDASGAPVTYLVTPAQTIVQQTLAAGATAAEQDVDLTIQVDVHGPASSDNAQKLSTLWRDPFAVDFFAASALAIAPLYADDPRQIPFINAEQQFETRWIVDLHLQANQIVPGLPQEATSVVSVTTVSVESLPSS